MIKIEKINELCKGKFLSLKEVFFDYKGKKRRWEVCNSMDSVAILIYDIDLESIILVKQFRLPVYLKNNDGYTYELCAGLCDKDKCSLEIAREEVLEECGYDVPSSKIQKITSTWASVGTNAANQTIYYVEVTQKEKVHNGGGIDDEDIEIFELPKNRVKEFIFDESKVITPGAKFALMWWVSEKMK
ncbi:NUDIX domain-containing protein [Caminibacter pacificus]|jgi:UDP-sugar diphosphatase|uniref:NUDIX hydrolase n=1 Tax=Caminibacter pacificus TaxID=1424653 RepID=A0AAJ4UYS5_9BACT|nr:NUDIX hydrolase [Caminibacter pacificus]QCI28179.1 NUDIX hydrolase [Caminibacter pacificus]ROR41108.1 UDP-sugar diphosphatase [Caminibacter pacificus]